MSLGFDQLWERVQQTRQRVEFRALQATFPPLMPSEYDPLRPTLSDDDRLERWLLSLDEATWQKMQAPSAMILDDAPAETGDALVDEWEREFWAKQRER